MATAVTTQKPFLVAKGESNVQVIQEVMGSGVCVLVATTMKCQYFLLFFAIKGGRQHSLNVFRATSQRAGPVQHTSAVWKRKKKNKFLKKWQDLKLCTTKCTPRLIIPKSVVILAWCREFVLQMTSCDHLVFNKSQKFNKAAFFFYK